MSKTAFDTAEVNLLEERLLALGRSEFSLQQEIEHLLARTRSEGENGNFEASEEAWTLHQEAKATLASLRLQITAVEVKLYSLRRRMRH